MINDYWERWQKPLFVVENGIGAKDVLVDTEDGLTTDFVHRSFLQLAQLDEIGGVSVLGGSGDRHEGIRFAAAARAAHVD